jgi:Family of unknown function (DUF5678)
MPRRISESLWRVARRLPYVRGMGGVARWSGKTTPIPRLDVLDDYAGEWVAVKDGKVIAHSPSSREVVRQMRKLGQKAQGAVLQRAAGSTEAPAVGLG